MKLSLLSQVISKTVLSMLVGDRHQIIINPPPQMLVGKIDKEKRAVIFGVGFSEGYEDLMFDKEMSKNKYVRLVVIVDIKKNSEIRWKTPEFQQRVNRD